MATLMIVNSAPYGSEGAYNAARLAEALTVKDEWVDLFLMGDGVHAARRGQDPRAAYASVEAMIAGLLDKGVSVTACATCCQTRGLGEGDLIEGVRVGTIHDLAGLVLAADRQISF
jgi:sulfur relay (sulfurtransferase) complex TusBCD TusD component (DsrE family)